MGKVWEDIDLVLPTQYSFAKLYLKGTELTGLQNTDKDKLKTLLSYPKRPSNKRKKDQLGKLKETKEGIAHHFLKSPFHFADLFLETAPKRRAEILKLQEKLTKQFKSHLDFCSKDQIQMRKDIRRMYKLLEVLKENDEDWNSQAPQQELIKLIEKKKHPYPQIPHGVP